MRLPKVALATVMILTPLASAGTVYTVCPDGSGDFRTIQSAITAAANGDVIELCCDVPFTAAGGNVNISYQGKAVTVRSACGDPTRCVIDLQSHSRAFNFTSSEGPSSVLEGVTIAHGFYWTGPSAIYCEGSSPTIRNCVIYDNGATDGTGAMTCVSASSPVFEDCLFEGNNVNRGGAGALSCAGNSNPALANCVFRGNGATNGTGAMACASASSPVLENCLFDGNGVNQGGAGALSCAGNSNPALTNCVFRQNGATVGVGGIECNSSSPTLTGCIFDRNTVNEGGAGAMTFYSGSNASVGNCTFYDNWATSGAGALHFNASSPALDNVIIASWGSHNSAVTCAAGAAPLLSCCDIFGYSDNWSDCIAGQYGINGNISEDPLFCDMAAGDYTIHADSPCAPAHSGGCGLIGALPVGCGESDTGACCFSDGSCVVLGQQECTDQHGTYQGDGTTCDPNPCHPTPVRITTWGRVRAGFR